MAINFPDKPAEMSTKDFKDPKKAAEYQQAMADYNFALQTMQHVMNEEESTQTNMAKSRHDALMAIINNVKS